MAAKITGFNGVGGRLHQGLTEKEQMQSYKIIEEQHKQMEEMRVKRVGINSADVICQMVLSFDGDFNRADVLHYVDELCPGYFD